jgi:tetratricopeptide (TPR) repeat protein
LVEVRDGMKSAEPIYQKALADFRNLVALPGARPEFVRQIIEVLLEYGFRQIRADAVEKARGAWTEALAAIRSPAGTDMADEIADLATKLAINLAGMAQLDHQQGRFDKAHEMIAMARDLRRDRLASSPTVGQGALALARLELLEATWREERNNKKEALEASVRAGEQLVRCLSAKGEVIPEMTSLAAEIARVLAGAPASSKPAMVLASMVKESVDSANTPASLAMAEVLVKAAKLDEAWDLLQRLDAKGVKDGEWMKKTIPMAPPAGPRRDLHARWLAAPAR